MKDIKKDFESFVNDSSAKAGSSFVLQKIHSQLALPSAWKVASKLGVAHVASSLVTLMSCSQFGVRLFFDGHGLMQYFMKVSPTFCMAFCGALYLAITFLIARALLSRDEWLLLLRSRALSILSLSLVSLGGFALVSHEVTLQAGLLWLLGAFLGGEVASFKPATLKRLYSKI